MRITLFIAISLFFNGFTGCSNTPPEPEKVYVKTRIPRLKTLYRIEPYEIKDISSLDNLYYKILKKELHIASTVSQKRIHKIDFYERQNHRFNKEFSTKTTKDIK